MYTVEDSKKGAGEAKLPYEPSRKLIKALFPVSTLLQEEAKHQTVRLLTNKSIYTTAFKAFRITNMQMVPLT